MSKHTYGHVLMLASQRLVRLTADDDFLKDYFIAEICGREAMGKGLSKCICCL